MAKWKCKICNSEFDNFQAQGFDNKIYCPLCYFKELYRRTELERERLNNIINELEKYTIEQRNIAKDNLEIIGNEGKRMATRFVVYNEYLDKLKELKEGK